MSFECWLLSLALLVSQSLFRVMRQSWKHVIYGLILTDWLADHLVILLGYLLWSNQKLIDLFHGCWSIFFFYLRRANREWSAGKFTDPGQEMIFQHLIIMMDLSSCLRCLDLTHCGPVEFSSIAVLTAWMVHTTKYLQWFKDSQNA